ncbi:carbon-nitrogen hydrolase family protein [Spirosoma koreense]
MKIGVAQTRPVKGDIQQNIGKHKKLIELAVAEGADVLIFPELSLTGYEPRLASQLATTLADSRFDPFQQLADAHALTIGVGMPIRSDGGILIGMLIFQPNQPRQLYAKQHLHADEYPFFVQGQEPVFLTTETHKLALAICYELSVPEHAEKAHTSRADIYIASVAKSATGVEKAAERLSAIASEYSMTVLMANSVGYCDNFDSAGKSAIWNANGVRVGQLNEEQEGVLLIDTQTQTVIEKRLEETSRVG